MRFEVVALLPLAAAQFFSQAAQHEARSLDQYDDELFEARSLDQYDDEVFEILARHFASEEDYLEAREADPRGGGGHGGGHAGHAGHHGGHKGNGRHGKGRHGKKHHGKGRHGKGRHAHHAAHAASEVAQAAAGPAAEAAAGAAGGADPSGGAPAEQPAPGRRSIEDEDFEAMLYIRDLLDGFDAEDLDMY